MSPMPPRTESITNRALVSDVHARAPCPRDEDTSRVAARESRAGDLRAHTTSACSYPIRDPSLEDIERPMSTSGPGSWQAHNLGCSSRLRVDCRSARNCTSTAQAQAHATDEKGRPVQQSAHCASPPEHKCRRACRAAKAGQSRPLGLSLANRQQQGRPRCSAGLQLLRSSDAPALSRMQVSCVCPAPWGIARLMVAALRFPALRGWEGAVRRRSTRRRRPPRSSKRV